MQDEVVFKEEIYETDYSITSIHILLKNGKSVKLDINCGLYTEYFLDFLSNLPSRIDNSLNHKLKTESHAFTWTLLFSNIAKIFERYARELADQNTISHIEYDLNTELKEYDFKLTFSSIIIREK